MLIQSHKIAYILRWKRHLSHRFRLRRDTTCKCDLQTIRRIRRSPTRFFQHIFIVRPYRSGEIKEIGLLLNDVLIYLAVGIMSPIAGSLGDRISLSIDSRFFTILSAAWNSTRFVPSQVSYPPSLCCSAVGR